MIKPERTCHFSREKIEPFAAVREMDKDGVSNEPSQHIRDEQSRNC
jgi:hypothetical protein